MIEKIVREVIIKEMRGNFFLVEIFKLIKFIEYLVGLIVKSYI